MKKKILSIVLALCMVLTPLPMTATAETTATYDLTKGSVIINDESADNITINGNYNTTTANTIQITGTKNHNVTLNEVEIKSTNDNSPVTVDSSGTTTLTINGTNILHFASNLQSAALRKTAQGTLIIAGSGTLSVTGGYFSDNSGGAAIGGNDGESTANIIVESGTIQATSYSCAAAIGGGNMGSATNIQITGGSVSADSGHGAAIGGGGNNLVGGVSTYTGRNIVISGGTVEAYARDMNKCMAIGDGNVGSSDGYGMDTSGWGNILQPSAGMVSKVEYDDNGIQTSFDGNYGTNQEANVTRFGHMYITFTAGHLLTVQNGTGSGLYLEGKPVNISVDDPGYIEFSKWTLSSSSAVIASTTSKSTTLTMGSTDVTATANKIINYDSLNFVLSPLGIKGESGKAQQFAVGATYNGTALNADQMAGLSYTTTWSLSNAANSTISPTGLLTMGAETDNIKVNADITAGGKAYTAAADVLYKEADAGDLIVSGGLPGTDFTYADNVLTFTGSGTYLVGMKSGVTTAGTRIVVNGGTPKITLQDVNINSYSSSNCIFCVSAGSPAVTISGTNSLINTGSGDGSNGIKVMNGQSLTLDGGDSDTLTVKGNYFSVVTQGSLTFKGGHYSIGNTSHNLCSLQVGYNATCEVLGGIVELQHVANGNNTHVIEAHGDFRIIPAEGRQAVFYVNGLYYGNLIKYLTEPYLTGTVMYDYTKISFSDSLPAITAASNEVTGNSAGITVNGTSSATGYYRLYEGGTSSTPLAGDIMGSKTGTVELNNGTASPVSLTGLKEATVYDCCIVAAAGSGESAQVSKVVKVHFTTPLSAPTAGEVPIDYVGECLKATDTLASGTILQYASAEDAATWTDFPAGGVSLTSLLDSHEGSDSITLYVRKKVGTAYSAATAVSIPARPLCSVSLLDISYKNETVTVPAGTVYQFNVQSPSSWSGAAAGADSAVTLSPYISAAGTAENSLYQVFFRNPATANSFASKTAAEVIPARPAVPAVSAESKTSAYITLNPVTDAEYKLTAINGISVDNAQYQASNMFADLNPSTKYTFIQHLPAVEKSAGGDGRFASAESAPAEFTTAEFTALYNGSVEKAEWYSNSVKISASGCTVSDAENGTFSDSITVSETCADKTLYYKNKSGVVSPFTVSVKIDKTAPTGKITFGTSWWDKLLTDFTFRFYHTDPSTVTIESSDGESGVKTTQYFVAAEGTTYTQEQLAAKADGWQEYNAGIKPALTEGQKSVVYAKITNNAGFVTYLSSDGMILDNTPPIGTVKISTDSWTQFLSNITFGRLFKETQTATITADDNGSGVASVQYQLVHSQSDYNENGTWTDYPNSGVSLSTDDKYIVYAKITDKAGNYVIINSDGVVVDQTKPELTLSAPSGWQTDGDSMMVGVTAGDKLTGLQSISYTTDESNPQSGTVTLTNGSGSITLANQGKYNLTVTATDNAGNSVSQTALIQWDKSKPTIAVPCNSGKLSTSVKIDITATAGASGIKSVTVSKDNSQPQDITGSYQKGYIATANGSYVFTVTNGAGVSVSSSPLVVKNIDTTKPAVAINSNGYNEGSWTTYNVTLSVSNKGTNTGTTTFEYRINGGNWSPLTGGSITDYAEGTRTYSFRATSESGVVSDVKTYTVRIDSIAPFVTGVEYNQKYSESRIILFDEGTAVLNGSPFTSGSPVSDPGDYILSVTDRAGNNTTVHFAIYKKISTPIAVDINGAKPDGEIPEGSTDPEDIPTVTISLSATTKLIKPSDILAQNFGKTSLYSNRDMKDEDKINDAGILLQNSTTLYAKVTYDDGTAPKYYKIIFNLVDDQEIYSISAPEHFTKVGSDYVAAVTVDRTVAVKLKDPRLLLVYRFNDGTVTFSTTDILSSDTTATKKIVGGEDIKSISTCLIDGDIDWSQGIPIQQSDFVTIDVC